jgi:hypothetical protein
MDHIGSGPVTVARGSISNAPHSERGAEALDAGEFGEAVVVGLLEERQVAGDDAQQVVGVTEEPLPCTTWGTSATVRSKASTVPRSAPRMVTRTRVANVILTAWASRWAR